MIMEYVSRAQWGARPSARPLTPLRQVASEWYVHHFADAFPSSVVDLDGDGAPDAEERQIRDAQAYHIDGRGYRDIAYQWIIGSVSGLIYEGRGWMEGGATGSPEDQRSYASCSTGNWHGTVPASVDRAAVVEAHATVIAEGITSGRVARDVRIYGDRDVNPTACPGDTLYALIPAIRSRVAALVAGPVPVPDVPTVRRSVRQTRTDLEAALVHAKAAAARRPRSKELFRLVASITEDVAACGRIIDEDR